MQAHQWIDSGPRPWLHSHLGVDKRADLQASLEDAVDQCVGADMELSGTPGAAVAVMYGGQVVYEEGYGVRGLATGEPVTEDTVFRIGSVTKMMVAAGLMQLVEAGLVDLDAAITDFVPELSLAGAWPAELITVRQLLTHTTGYPDQVFDLGSVNARALAEWAGNQSMVELHAPPGAFYNYSNPNYALVGLVIERASGMSYRAYLSERLWGPAGFASMTFDPGEVVISGDWSWGHYAEPGTGNLMMIGPSLVDSGWFGPAAMAFSNARDLVGWALLLMEGGGPVLDSSSAEAMQAPQVWTHTTPAMHYGYGITHETYPEIGFRWHDGSIYGWSCMLLWEPERRFAVAVLANTAVPLTGAAGCILEATVDLPPVTLPDLETEPETWRRYAGRYELSDVYGSSFDARVSLVGDTLMLDVGPGSFVLPEGTVPMAQAYLDTFVVDTDGDTVPDTDLTFIGGPGASPRTHWMRNRYAVGTHVFPVRRVGGLVGP